MNAEESPNTDLLYKTGSYSMFDEPGSVEIARDALAPIRKPTASTETRGNNN